MNATPSGRKTIVAGAGLDATATDSYNSEYHLLDVVLPARCDRPMAFIPGGSTAESVFPGYERSDFFNS